MSEIIDLRFTTVKAPLPDFIHAGIKAHAADSNTYHHQPQQLVEKIAEMHGVDEDMVYLTAGADQALFLLVQKYGHITHVFTPTYIGYSDAERFGHQLHKHDSLNGGVYKIDVTRKETASLIVVANPNNPAGITSRTEILELVRNNPDALVAIDEAYGEFANESVISDVASHKNLVVVKSFSKAYALAGYRIGYIIAQKSVLDNLVFETTWFNTAHVSVGAAEVALDNAEYFTRMRITIQEERQNTAEVLLQAGYKIVESYINAVVLEFDSASSSGEFVDRLRSSNILVNQGNGESNIGVPDNFVRISIGTPQQMEHLRNIIKKDFA